jgi:hypothetical protein
MHAPPQGPPQGAKAPDGNSPDQMIGYIDPNASPKVKTYLLTAKQFLLNAQGAQFVKSLLKTAKGDPSTAIAMFIGKLLEKLQDKLGPLGAAGTRSGRDAPRRLDRLQPAEDGHAGAR